MLPASQSLVFERRKFTKPPTPVWLRFDIAPYGVMPSGTGRRFISASDDGSVVLYVTISKPAPASGALYATYEMRSRVTPIESYDCGTATSFCESSVHLPVFASS